jgi:ABC-type glycerol-3-phosphate transport system substrate-binding protein
MKKIVAILISIALLVSLAACGGSSGSSGSARSSSVSEEDAIAAFTITASVVMMSAMFLAFGQEIEGISMDDENTLVFDNVSIASMFEGMGEAADDLPDIAYTTFSGTAASSEEGTVIDLSLEGGPVSTLKYTLTEEMISIGEDETVTVSMEANGNTLNIDIDAEKLEAVQ